MTSTKGQITVTKGERHLGVEMRAFSTGEPVLLSSVRWAQLVRWIKTGVIEDPEKLRGPFSEIALTPPSEPNIHVRAGDLDFRSAVLRTTLDDWRAFEATVRAGTYDDLIDLGKYAYNAPTAPTNYYPVPTQHGYAG